MAEVVVEEPGRPLIFHLIAHLEVGGAEVALANLLSALTAEERAFHRVISMCAPGPVAARIRELGVEVSSLDLKCALPGPKALLRLGQRLQAVPAWRLQGWMYQANLLATAFCLLRRQTAWHVWGVQNSLAHLPDGWAVRQAVVRLGAVLSRFPAMIVYAADSTARQYAGIGYARTRQRVVRNGVERRVFHPDASAGARLRGELGLPEVPLIGHVARYEPSKDHATFVEMLGELRRRGVMFRAVMAGQGVDTNNAALMSQLARAGVSEWVRLLGPRLDLPLLMPGLDVFCMTARIESMPLTVVEAMLCGVPCVVSDVGDAAAVVSATGTPVPPGQPRAMAEAVARFLAMPREEKEAYDRQARLRGEDYSVARMAEGYLTLYRELGWMG